jgi:hypothetical protein
MKLVAFNLSSGEVEIHKAGCADIKRNTRKRGNRQDQVEFGTVDWPTKYDFCHEYWDNGILEENEAENGVGTFDVWQEMVFEPCCAALPEGGPEAPATATASKREATQDLARRLVMAATMVFDGSDGSEAWAAGMSREEAEQKIANWLHHLPTGGAGADRFWPEGFTRPSQSDWQK